MTHFQSVPGDDKGKALAIAAPANQRQVGEESLRDLYSKLAIRTA
jgi:hypothetical protein